MKLQSFPTAEAAAVDSTMFISYAELKFAKLYEAAGRLIYDATFTPSFRDDSCSIVRLWFEFAICACESSSE